MSSFLSKKLKNVTNKATEDVIKLTDHFQKKVGLTRGQRIISNFTELFPWNIMIVFVLFLSILVGINYLIKYTIGRLPEDEQKRLMEAKKESLVKLSKGMQGDHDLYVEATLELEEIEKKMKAPGQLQSDIMTVLSLTVAIAGIFSLPLLTSATMKLLATRIMAARRVVESDK